MKRIVLMVSMLVLILASSISANENSKDNEQSKKWVSPVSEDNKVGNTKQHDQKVQGVLCNGYTRISRSTSNGMVNSSGTTTCMDMMYKITTEHTLYMDVFIEDSDSDTSYNTYISSASASTRDDDFYTFYAHTTHKTQATRNSGTATHETYDVLFPEGGSTSY